MKLKNLLAGAEVLELHADENLEITGVSYDSRETKKGDVFVAISGYAMGVVTGLLPTTGVSLPFFSYGGTALTIQLFEMGIVLSVSRQMKI